MKFEAAQQATRKDRHPIRAVNESDTSNSSVERLERQMRSFLNRVESLMSQKADGKKTLKCWTCGREGHLQRSCRARQGTETNKRLPEGGVGKLINDHLVGAEVARFWKAPHSSVSNFDNEYRSQCVYHSERSGSKIKRETYLDPAQRGATDRDGEKIDIHGKLKVKIQFGDTTYQHAVYVADIADPFILGLDFLKEHGFTLDFNKNELRSIHEEVTIFKIKHRTESIRQVTANENITIPPRTEIIVPGYIGNDVSFNSGLIGSAENKANGLLIASALVDLSEKLSRNSSDIGHTTVTQHRIDTADHPPIKQHPRRLPFAKQEEVGTLLREMQENDIIEPSSSPWASPIVLVHLKSGYWQVEIHPKIEKKTAFTSGQGLWQFKVMPFGLCNAPATFERLMETVLKGLTFEACLIYLDDVIIGGRTFEEHLQNIRKKVFVRTRKVSAVKNWKRPENLRELRSFLGLCTYYRKFVKGFSNIARPLHKLTESKQKFQWTKECEDSFLQLKEALTSSPILIYPQPDKPFILDTDASNESVGAVLSQEIDGQEQS
ncbi:retrovirus-related Pol polyprotein from transposon 17.6 [Trichonephila clavipes]|nr:retrovirus-related Pol polyprotein from transposon 17.6 [Trichonephila clavipes]